MLYFYAPDLIFRFGASGVFGFRTPKSDSQVQEFFAAGLPSLFLNLEALLAFNVAVMVAKHRWFLPSVAKLAPLLGKDPNFAALTARDLLAPLCYLGFLYLNAFRVGSEYGRESQGIAINGDFTRYFQSSRVSGWRYLTYRFWYLFYSKHHDTFYPILLRKSLAFVHTADGIFYGRIYQSDQNREGDNESIYLIEASKYNRSEQEAMLERGENPITDLSGPIYIKWSEIKDINFPHDPDDTLVRKRAYFEWRLKNAPHQDAIPFNDKKKKDDDVTN